MRSKIFSAAAISACLACTLLLTACSPKDYTFTMSKDWRQDKKLQEHFQQLTHQEQDLFTAYTERVEQEGAAGKNAAGMITIGEAIQLQAKWQSEHPKTEAAPTPATAPAPTPTPTSEETAHLQLLKQMRSVITPAVTSLKYVKNKSAEGWELGTTYKNNGSLKVTGIEGTLVIGDGHGIELKRSTVQSEMAIEPGALQAKVWNLEYNSKNAADQILKKADATKLVFSWYPSTYRFADGSELSLVK
jgi:hypothetical protein